MKKLVIFDLDGTLLDTSEGILNCHKYAHSYMGVSVPEISVLQRVIGAPLYDTYVSNFSFSHADARKAVDAYRKRYEEKGIHEAYVYPDIPSLLKNLRDDGYILMVATLKREDFAQSMLREFGIAGYFSSIFGVDTNDKKSKADLLRICTLRAGVTSKEAVLVGDSHFDYEGASECGIDFVGVTYGFGFHDEHEYDGIVMCSGPNQIYDAVNSL